MLSTCSDPASKVAHVHKAITTIAAAAQLLQHVFGFDRRQIYLGECLRSCTAVVASRVTLGMGGGKGKGQREGGGGKDGG